MFYFERYEDGYRFYYGDILVTKLSIVSGVPNDINVYVPEKILAMVEETTVNFHKEVALLDKNVDRFVEVWAILFGLLIIILFLIFPVWVMIGWLK